MTTQEIVDRLIALVKEGKNVQAEEELYAQDVVSFEQNGYSTSGLEATIEKTKAAFANVEEMFGGGITQAYVGASSFLLVFEMDMKPKGGERMQAKEYGFYKVKDGKIAEEYFFAEPLALS